MAKANLAAELAAEADERVQLLMRENAALKKKINGYTTQDAIVMAAVQAAWQEPPQITLRPPPRGKGKAAESALLHLTDLHGLGFVKPWQPPPKSPRSGERPQK